MSYELSAMNCYAQTAKYIRVAIVQDAASLNLKVKGAYEIIDSVSKEVLTKGEDLKTTVTAYRDGILLGGKNFATIRLFIKTQNQEAITIDGRRFRGDIQLIEKDNLRLMVINHIDLEGYIQGILYHEASHYWPYDALKAQAIACRTFALYQMQKNALKDYDVTSDIYSQVYGGRTSERYRTTKAVEETKGEILTYQNKIFPAYYHATCAGHTEDASFLWNIDMVPLRGILCLFCKDSPHFRWHYVLSLDAIKDKLVNFGYPMKKIKNIEILGRDRSHRIISLNIASDNKDINIMAKDLRNILGPNIIRSTNFNIQIVDSDVIFQGFGWGHGVGLCQWGAYFMAKRGYNYKKILKYYYPESELSLISQYEIN
jgi:stage II sporulation protein D